MDPRGVVPLGVGDACGDLRHERGEQRARRGERAEAGVDFVPEAYALKGSEQEESTAMLLGRRSYQLFSPVWPGMDDFAGPSFHSARWDPTVEWKGTRFALVGAGGALGAMARYLTGQGYLRVAGPAHPYVATLIVNVVGGLLMGLLIGLLADRKSVV